MWRRSRSRSSLTRIRSIQKLRMLVRLKEGKSTHRMYTLYRGGRDWKVIEGDHFDVLIAEDLTLSTVQLSFSAPTQVATCVKTCSRFCCAHIAHRAHALCVQVPLQHMAWLAAHACGRVYTLCSHFYCTIAGCLLSDITNVLPLGSTGK